MANSLRNSLLQIAIYSDHIQATEQILMGNLQVATCENREGQTLLLAAARKGLYNAVLFLLNLEGTHQHHRDMHAYNVVHHASISQNPNMVRVALSINPRMIQDVSSAATGGCTPAHLALTPAKPNPRVAQLLINSPHFQTNAQDMRGRTVLHLAAHGGHLSILKMLISRVDLDLNRLDIEHNTAFDLACQAGRHRILSVLMQDPRLSLATGEQNERFSKIEKDDLSSVYGLASQPLLRLSCGLNIFHLAAFSGAFKITDWLVKHFPEQVNEKTPKLFCGRSAVHFAILKGHTQLALVLISSPNCCRFITDDLERSLLHCSACFGNVEVTKELMLYVPYTIKS